MSTVGRVQAFNGAAEEFRRTAHDAAQDVDEIPPAAGTRKPGANSRHRNPPITIELRPDPTPDPRDETARKARRGAFEDAGARDDGSRRRGVPEASPEPPWTYRSNPDAPYRRRTSDETYQAIEAVDTPVPHRGGIYDRRI